MVSFCYRIGLAYDWTISWVSKMTEFCQFVENNIGSSPRTKIPREKDCEIMGISVPVSKIIFSNAIK